VTVVTLDAGALIAVERGAPGAAPLLVRRRGRLVIPAGVVGQVWRDGRRQARLAALLASSDVEIEELTETRARAAGQLCGRTGTTDVIDASVALCARRHGGTVVTSDPDDLRRLDPTLRLIVV
jgi:predicted nucleic acid-binding protein